MTGHSLTQILDIIPRSSCSTGESYCTYRVPFPKYIKLDNNIRRLREISVRLANEEGKSIEFGEGTGVTRLSLHFLSKKNLHHNGAY